MSVCDCEPVISKRCSTCNRRKSLQHFCKDRSSPDGLSYGCRLCRTTQSREFRTNNPDYVLRSNRAWREKHRGRYNHRAKKWRDENPVKLREYHLRVNYGLSIAGYNELLRKQKNRCAICGRNGILVVDHDHKTNRVRGLIHSRCNRAIALLGDNSHGVRKALRYLEQQ